MSKCYRCFRPEKSCYCKYIKSFDCGVKFVLLMHPKEAFKQKTGTGRLTNIALIDSEIIIGVDFTENKRLKELFSDEQYYPVLLYPDENAWTASNPALKTQLGENKKLLVIVLDATWPLAKKCLNFLQTYTKFQKFLLGQVIVLSSNLKSNLQKNVCLLLNLAII